ncbi:MAG: response regulator [Patescibacteria group bacterium]|nr:response regulator [Patescibacteria group bacterium]
MAELRPKKILLIDDEKSFCEVISFALKKAGFEIICYYDPKEALLKIIEDLPDLILLDIAIPEMNGLELLIHLKKDLGRKCPPIIFLTNLKYTEDGKSIDKDFSQSIGAVDVIHKSDNLDEMIGKINKALGIE